MKLNAVGRHSRLSVDKVKESNTRDLHRHTDGSKRSGRSETSVKLLSGVGDAGGERTIHCHATRTRYFGDHCRAVFILHDDVIVDVTLELEHSQGRPDHVDSVFSRRKPRIVGRC